MTNNSILITPDATLVCGKTVHPDSINIVLESGTSYDLDTILVLLYKLDKKKIKKLGLFARTKRGFTAFNKALKETDPTLTQ